MCNSDQIKSTRNLMQSGPNVPLGCAFASAFENIVSALSPLWVRFLGGSFYAFMREADPV